MIVVDVGCAKYGEDYSVERLLEMFEPSVLYGFDPAWEWGMWRPKGATTTRLDISREAAWTYDGWIGYRVDGLTSHATDEEDAPKVPCIDLARFIEQLPKGPVVLKLDCEGAEYELLEHLLDGGTVALLSRLLVEWHDRDEGRRHKIEKRLDQAETRTEQWQW